MLIDDTSMLRLKYSEQEIAKREIKVLIADYQIEISSLLIGAYINFKIGELRFKGIQDLYLFTE